MNSGIKQHIERTIKASGVPLKVKSKAAIKRIASLLS